MLVLIVKYNLVVVVDWFGIIKFVFYVGVVR